MPTQTTLRIEMFGGLRVHRGADATIHFESRKAAALLAYLSLFNKHSHPREVLAELLWPGEGPDATRTRLRQVLSALRRVLEPDANSKSTVLVADRADAFLVADAYTTDVAEFDSALKEYSRVTGPPERFSALKRAIQLYSGELLPGYYEDWAIAERDRLAEAHRDALGQAALAAAASGDFSAAIEYSRREVGADPLREDAHCRLMRFYGDAGRISDAMRQYHELERALRDGLALSPTSKAKALLAELRSNASSAQDIRPDPGADAHRRRERQPNLEPEGGAVPLESPFYIVRPTDTEFDAAVARRDSIVLVKGARQMGKTSLLARGLQAARAAGANVVFTDLQKLTASQLASADTLFFTLAEGMADQLDLNTPVATVWNENRGWNVNFERFVRREVLDRIDGHVVWVLEEVDRLFAYPFCAETFGLLRAWHNERALNPAAPWGRLTMAISYATEAHLFISDLNQSPFNVGTRLTLDDLTLAEVSELNRRYDHPLRSDKEVARYFGLLGGQPYLVRRGLHVMVDKGMDIDAFMEQADQEDGIYGDHLRRTFGALRGEDSLCSALRTVIAGEPCATTESFYRLRSAGILAGKSANQSRFRCRLYQTFFARRLR